jgi:hypothetical protein
VRRIGILLPAAADDAVWQARIGAFLQELALLGWAIGRNVRVDIRWGTTNAAEIRRQAEELVALAPDDILAGGTSSKKSRQPLGEWQSFETPPYPPGSANSLPSNPSRLSSAST